MFADVVKKASHNMKKILEQASAHNWELTNAYNSSILTYMGLVDLPQINV